MLSGEFLAHDSNSPNGKNKTEEGENRLVLGKQGLDRDFRMQCP